MADLKRRLCGAGATFSRGCGRVLAVLRSNPSGLRGALCREREVHFMVKEKNQRKG